MIDRVFTPIGVVVGVVVLLGAVVVAVEYREGPYGNVASIVGLAVSVLGFVVTVWTVLDARRQIQDAAERAAAAVAEAREATRQAMLNIAKQLRASDCAALLHAVEGLRVAAQNELWPYTVYSCQACRATAHRLEGYHSLTADEKSMLRQTADDLCLIQQFVEDNRMHGQGGRLKRSHVDSLDRAIDQLVRLQARLHHESLGQTV